MITCKVFFDESILSLPELPSLRALCKLLARLSLIEFEAYFFFLSDCHFLDADGTEFKSAMG